MLFWEFVVKADDGMAIAIETSINGSSIFHKMSVDRGEEQLLGEGQRAIHSSDQTDNGR